jgi:hypothetical protein
MLVNEYELYVSVQKSSKDAKFVQYLYPPARSSPALIFPPASLPQKPSAVQAIRIHTTQTLLRTT